MSAAAKPPSLPIVRHRKFVMHRKFITGTSWLPVELSPRANEIYSAFGHSAQQSPPWFSLRHLWQGPVGIGTQRIFSNRDHRRLIQEPYQSIGSHTRSMHTEIHRGNAFTPNSDHFKFPLQPHQKYHITQYEERGFSYLTQMRDNYTNNILITSLIHFSLKVGRRDSLPTDSPLGLNSSAREELERVKKRRGGGGRGEERWKVSFPPLPPPSPHRVLL